MTDLIYIGTDVYDLSDFQNTFNSTWQTYNWELDGDQNHNGTPDWMEGIGGWVDQMDDLTGSDGMYDFDEDGDIDFTDAASIFGDRAATETDPGLQQYYLDQQVNANLAGGMFDWVQGDNND